MGWGEGGLGGTPKSHLDIKAQNQFYFSNSHYLMTHNNEKPHGNTLGPMAPPTDHLAAAKYVYMGQQLATIQ